MAEIKVTSSELKSKANQLQVLNDKFKTEVDKMVGYEQNLSGMWEGEAQKAFHKAFSDDKQKWELFYQGIQKYIEALNTDAQKYDEAEQKALSTAQQRTV